MISQCDFRNWNVLGKYKQTLADGNELNKSGIKELRLIRSKISRYRGGGTYFQLSAAFKRAPEALSSMKPEAKIISV